MVILLIYLLGCIISFILNYQYTLDEDEEITVNDLGFILLLSFASWLSVFVGFFALYGDKVIVHKKSKRIHIQWTEADNGKVEEIKGALLKLEREHSISFIEEIEWLNNLKYRIIK